MKTLSFWEAMLLGLILIATLLFHVALYCLGLQLAEKQGIFPWAGVVQAELASTVLLLVVMIHQVEVSDRF
ncbi:hypothetical protein BH11PAT4_BH11PAT4_0560 [soil metagenome]